MAIHSRRVVIFGGRGFLGTLLCSELAPAGWDVTVVARSVGTGTKAPVRIWDGRSVGEWKHALDGADALINLAGRSVDCRKTPENREEIMHSRVGSTEAIGRACAAVSRPPRVWVQMSTAHMYGDPQVERCDESTPSGVGLAPNVGRAWEAAHHAHLQPGQRSVILRTGFVIGRPNAGGRGALGKLAPLCRAGLGGRVGTGTQGMSWIHERDFVRIVERALLKIDMSGVYNVVAPHPVEQTEFMRTLRRYAGGLGSMGLALPTPAPLVRFGARWILNTDPELALLGRYVLPKRLLDEDFSFSFPTIDGAVREIFLKPRTETYALGATR